MVLTGLGPLLDHFLSCLVQELSTKSWSERQNITFDKNYVFKPATPPSEYTHRIIDANAKRQSPDCHKIKATLYRGALKLNVLLMAIKYSEQANGTPFANYILHPFYDGFSQTNRRYMYVVALDQRFVMYRSHDTTTASRARRIRLAIFG
jgi:hypothetical protein